MTMDSQTFSAFFYGTLMHPSILRRVIGHDGDALTICPALLLSNDWNEGLSTEHTRHQVQWADYPGVIPYSKTRSLLKLQNGAPDLPAEERSVRGTLVQGLTEEDVNLLDIFEGNEYSRELVSVHPLGPLVSLSTSTAAGAFDITPSTPPPIPDVNTISSTHPPVVAHIYIWVSPMNELKPDIWEFAEFVRTNAWKWVGDDEAVTQNKDYLEVDKRREMGGIIVRREIVDAGDEKKVVIEVEEK